MKLAFIVPTKYISQFGTQGHFTLALSHLMKKDGENEYEKAIKEAGLPIILDNGLFENHVPEGIETLIEKANRIGATHFFAPDVLFDRKGTEEELKKAVLAKEKYPNLKLGAVVQANSPEEYLDALLKMNNDPNVDLIGLSILSIPKSWEKKLGKFDVTASRIELLRNMKALSAQGVKWKDCHLLGLGDSYADVLFAAEECPWVVSNDTSCCFQTGLFKKKLTEDLVVPGGKIQKKVDFDLQGMTVLQVKTIESNIYKVKDKFKKYDN